VVLKVNVQQQVVYSTHNKRNKGCIKRMTYNFEAFYTLIHILDCTSLNNILWMFMYYAHIIVTTSKKPTKMECVQI
jgi:hypothetical protein